MKRSQCSLFAALIVLFCLSTAHAQSFARLTNETWVNTDLAQTYDHPLLQKGGNINNAPSSSGVFWWDSYGRVRINRTDQDAPFFGYRILTIGIGTDSRFLKATMDEFDLALGLHLGDFGGWKVGATLGAGFSSTKPFVNPTGIFGIGHLTAERPISDHNSILLAIDYEANGGLFPDVPLPGFGFLHHDDQLEWMAGFPMSQVRWRPSLPWEITAHYSVPFTAEVDGEYRLAKHVGLYANAANFFQGFVVATGDITNRQFYQMRRVETGIRFIFDPWVDASLGVGYAFDQGFSTGFNVRNMHALSHISNEPYLALVLRGTF